MEKSGKTNGSFYNKLEENGKRIEKEFGAEVVKSSMYVVRLCVASMLRAVCGTLFCVTRCSVM